MAGSVAARQSVKTYQQLRTLWGKGDEEKAVALTKVFSLAMLSAYLRPARGSEPATSGDRGDTVREWAKAILELFEDDSPESLEHFLGVDRQYAYDVAQARQSPLSDVIYFSDAVAALGGRSAVKLTAGELPVKNYTYGGLVGRGVIPESALPDFVSWRTFSGAATMLSVDTAAGIERRLAEYYDGTPEAEVHLRRAEELERGLQQAARKLKELKQD